MWTPEKAARLAELEAGFSGQLTQAQAQPQPEQMGIGRRLLRGLGNTPSHIVNMGQAIGDTLLGTETAPKQIFHVPEATTTGEAVADFMGQLPAELATLATGAGAATKGLRMLGAGKRIAPVVGEAVAGAASGLRTSGEESAMQAGEFGVMGGIMQSLAGRNPLARALLSGAANVGVGAAGQAARGNDLTSPEALKQMAVMGLLPMAQEGMGAAGRRLLRRAEPPPIMVNVDEVIPPGGNEPLALENRRLMLEGPSAYGQSATDRRFRTIDEPYIPEQGVIPMGRTERPLLNAPPRERILSTAIMTPEGPVMGANPNAAHPTMLMEALERGLSETDYPRHLGFMARLEDGSERFVDRTEGYRIATGARQTKTTSPRGELQSEILETISPPQTTGAAPTMLRSGEPASSGGRGLKPLGRSQSGAVNPMLLAPIAGAGVGAISDTENPLQGALIGAAIATGGAKGAKFLRSAKLREAADKQMRPQESTPLGKAARFMEKNMNMGKSSRLTSLDDRAKGEADFYAGKMDQALKGAGRMAYGENLTPAQKAAGEAFIGSKGDPVDLAKLRAAGVPREYQQFLETAKDSQKQMQGILMRAESDPKKQNLIANTLGTYQTKQYRYFLQPDKFKINDADKAAVVSEWQNNPIFQGVDPAALKTAVVDDLDQHLRELADNGGDFTRLANEGKSKISQSLFKSRKELTPAYRKLLGEVSDPHEANVLTANKLMQSVAQAKIVGDLRTAVDGQGNRFAMPFKEWTAAVAAAQRAGDKAKVEFLSNRYVNAPDSPGIGALAGQKVQRQVADHFQFSGHEGLQSGNGSWYAALNSVPKAVFTRLNPAAWVRNYGQAVLQGHALGIWDPSKIVKTAWRLSKDPDLRDDLVRSGVLGAHAGRHEFGQQAKSLGDALNKGISGRMKAVMGAINEGYGKPDTWIRATAYLDEMEKGIAKGLNREEAGLKALEFVNRYSHNYGQVPKIVGKARNIPLVNPFLSYSTEMGRILKNLAEDVVSGNDRAIQSGGALLSLLAMPAMLTYAAKELGLTEEQQKELETVKQLMPPYMRGRLNATYAQDEKGEFKSASLGPWLPAGDFVSLAKNILNLDAEALATNNPIASTSGTPLLNAYTELRTGKDLVTGQTTSPLEVAAKNVIPMYYRGGQIAKSFTPNEDGEFGVEEPSGRRITPGNAIAGALGFGTTSVSTKRLLRRVDAQAKQELSDAKREATQILRTNAAPQVKESARQEFAEKKRRILLRRTELLERAKP
jgi:hypothetical protein